MENKKNMFAAAAVLVVALMGLSSCTKDDMVSDSKVQRTTEFIPTPTPTPEPTPKEWKWEKDSINHGDWYEFNINGAEVYSGAHQRLSGVARINLEKYEYYTEDIHRNLSVNYANNHRTFGAAKVDGNKYTRGASFAHEDGQITYVNVDIKNDSIAHATVKDINIVSVRNLEEATTRAQYVSDTLRTEFVAEVEFEVSLDGERYSYSELLKDTCTRYLLSEDDIASTSYNSERAPIDATSEKVTVVKTVTMKSGEKRELTYTYVLPVFVETITFDARETQSFDWSLIESLGLSVGEVERLAKNEDVWEDINIRKDIYNGIIGWNDEYITTKYYVNHGAIRFNDGNKVIDFPFIDPQVEELSTVVNLLSSDRDGYEMAKVVNTIKVNYEGMTQNASEDCILYKEVAPEPEPEPAVVDEYFDESTLIDILTDNFRRVSITWIQTTDGVITDSQVLTKEFERPLVCKTNWSVDSENYSQNTTGIAYKLTASSPKSEGSWNWNADTYTITEKVTGAGWSESNGWESGEASGIAVIYNGKTYHFADKSVSVSSDATVDGSGNYTSRLNYVFGDNTKYSDAPGKITLVAPEPDPFFPKNWGRILGANQTVAPTANHDGYVYTLVFRFENGTLGVIMNGGESQINWDNFSHFTTDTDQSINGLAYLKGQNEWMFVSADDYADALTYVQTNGQMVDNIAYPKAKSLGWDEGHLVNNHASVFTSRYSMSIVDNVVTIVDTYTGVNYGSFDSAK